MISEKHQKASRENLKKAILKKQEGAWHSLNCKYCGKETLVRRSAIKKGWKYCSWDCRVNGMRGENGSNSGGGQWMVGDKNINYKHGKSSETLQRDLTLVNRWRRRVFERDKYICQICGFDKGHTLRAHHIKSWSDYEELRFDISNGITLCDRCHKWVHSKKNINKEFICK